MDKLKDVASKMSGSGSNNNNNAKPQGSSGGQQDDYVDKGKPSLYHYHIDH